MIAIVTGGTRGIGEATVREFRRAGHETVFFYRNSDTLASEIEKATGAVGMKCDVADAKNVEEAVKEVIRRFGRIDILVNNAGVSLVKPFDACSENELEALYGTNLFGTLNCCRIVSREMIKKKSGAIVNVSSMWGTHGASCEVDYSCSKGGIIALTKALARELGPSGIRVNCVCPGFIDTDMNSSLSEDDRNEFCSSLALGRIGKAEEVASAISFLSSERASYITAACLPVDGGY